MADGNEGIYAWVPNVSYLRSNTASHSWAFGAIAELIDNAYDANAGECRIQVLNRTTPGQELLLIIDNGYGMAFEELQNMLCLGSSGPRADTNSSGKRLGRFGSGFKSGSMKLAKDALVLTKKGDILCAGMLSQTYNENRQTVLLPMVAGLTGLFDQPTETDKKNRKAIQSVFGIEELNPVLELMSTLTTGTAILLKRLECNFRFDDENDIKLQSSNGTAGFDHQHSLRDYCGILFRKRDMAIQIGEKEVMQLDIEENLSEPQTYSYTPNPEHQGVETKITVGLNTREDWEGKSGIMIYWRNRLIRAFEQDFLGFPNSLNSQIKQGCLGLVDLDEILEPVHSKQDFERNAQYTNAIRTFRDNLTKYCADRQPSEVAEDRPCVLDTPSSSPVMGPVPGTSSGSVSTAPQEPDSRRTPAKRPRSPYDQLKDSAKRACPGEPDVSMKGTSKLKKAFRRNVFRLLSELILYFGPDSEPVETPFFELGKEDDIESTVDQLVAMLGLGSETKPAPASERFDIPAPPKMSKNIHLMSWDSIVPIFIDTEGREHRNGLHQIAAIRTGEEDYFEKLSIQPDEMEQTLGALCDFLSRSQNNVLFGHSIHTCDRPELMRAIDHCGLMDRFQKHVMGFVDTHTLFKRAHPQLESHRLEDLVTHFLGIPYSKHNARADALVLEKLVAKEPGDKKSKKRAYWSMEHAKALFLQRQRINENYPSLKPMVDSKIIEPCDAEKIARSGLNQAHLTEVFNKAGASGIRDVLAEPTDSGVRVTRKASVATAIASYLFTTSNSSSTLTGNPEFQDNFFLQLYKM